MEPERLQEYGKLGVGFKAIRMYLAFELIEAAFSLDLFDRLAVRNISGSGTELLTVMLNHCQCRKTLYLSAEYHGLALTPAVGT